MLHVQEIETRLLLSSEAGEYNFQLSQLLKMIFKNDFITRECIGKAIELNGQLFSQMQAYQNPECK